MRIRYTPAVGLDTNLLTDTVRYVLSGYRPEGWQTEITNEQLLALARSLQPEHLAVIRESRVWVDLKASTTG